jgi:acetyl esterase
VTQGFEVTELLSIANAIFPKLGSEITDAVEARAAFAAMPRRALLSPQVASTRDVVLTSGRGSRPARVYQAREPANDDTAIVFFHGGGWVLGGLDSHDWLARSLCAGTGAATVSVDYRLAPEHPYPAALDDAVDAVLACLQGEVLVPGPTRIVVAGDSAGGALATAVCLRARDSGGPAPQGQILLYPVLSSRRSTPSYDENATGRYITRQHLTWFWEQYLATSSEIDSYASPGDVPSVDGLPPTVLVTAGLDPLRDEGLEYGRRLALAGVPTTLLHYPEAFHGFLGFQGVLELADRAMRDVQTVSKRLVLAA